MSLKWHYGVIPMASSRSASTTVTSLMKTSSYASGPSGINKECSRDGVLVELISIQAQVRADALALASASESLTYGKLEAESNKLAHYLRLAGVGPEVIVGLCMERWRVGHPESRRGLSSFGPKNSS